MKRIKLTQGKYTLVDDEDYEELNQYNWYAVKKYDIWYAQRKSIIDNNKYETIYIHYQIIGEKGIDHKDGDGLNNQRGNLRKCTKSQNAMNKKTNKGSSSIFKGVSWHKRDYRWVSQIVINGKKIHLGYFTCELLAALTYDKEANKLFGEFARLNIVRTKNKKILF